MSIYLYTGTPGSGKSAHMAKDIITKLRRRQNVIANFQINEEIVTGSDVKIFNKIIKKKKKIGDYFYIDNEHLKPSLLIHYANLFHEKYKENQTLIIIDESQLIFNSRDWNMAERMEWIKFFTLHRKLGFNIILGAQFDRMLDRQIRCLVEIEVKHRKVNARLPWLPWLWLIQVDYWYGINMRMGASHSGYNKKIFKLYDTYQIFEV